MTIRESTFLCTWLAGDARQNLCVRAWTAREALDLVRAHLRDIGSPMPEDVAVEALGRGSGRRAVEAR